MFASTPIPVLSVDRKRYKTEGVFWVEGEGTADDERRRDLEVDDGDEEGDDGKHTHIKTV